LLREGVVDLERMLDKCKRGQWTLDDVDWSAAPRAMSRDDEEDIVQYFVDMAAIERFAKALFEEQQRRAKNPVLAQIYATFIADEERHALAAERLARHFDVHHYRVYRTSEELERFKPPFLDAIRLLSDEVANAYITGGELMLDVALLRSIDDFVNDPTSRGAMALINRDEARHIAVDYHMIEYYTTDEFWQARARLPRPSLARSVRTAVAILKLFRASGPFFMHMFVRPMQRTDPKNERLLEAFKRMQLLQNMPGVERSPLARFTRFVCDTYNHPLWGPLFGGAVQKFAGFPPELLKNLYTDEEAALARRRGFDELARETTRLSAA
jgi:hypothetical protein